MDANVVSVSAKEKIRIIKKILLLSKMAEEYSGNRKVLGYLLKVVKDETKVFQKTKLPMSSEDKREVNRCLYELKDLIVRLRKAKNVDAFRIAEDALHTFSTRLTQEIAAFDHKAAQADKIQDAREFLTAAVDGAKKLGSKVVQGVETIKKSLRQKTEENSKTVESPKTEEDSN